MSPAGRQKERAAEASKGTPGTRSPLLPIVRALGSRLGSTGNSRRQPGASEDARCSGETALGSQVPGQGLVYCGESKDNQAEGVHHRDGAVGRRGQLVRGLLCAPVFITITHLCPPHTPVTGGLEPLAHCALCIGRASLGGVLSTLPACTSSRQTGAEMVCRECCRGLLKGVSDRNSGHAGTVHYDAGCTSLPGGPGHASPYLLLRDTPEP